MKKFSQIKHVVFLAIILFGLIACQSSSNEKYFKPKSEIVIEEIDITTIQASYNSGDFTIEQLITAYLNRIDSIDQNGPELHAIITLNPDALAIARELDKELESGKSRGPLHGIPVILKDNMDTRDKMPTTAGSRAMANSFPLEDSFIAEQLRNAGAVILGKANLSEWANFRGAKSTSGWSGLGGQTKNPYVLEHNPCGSSSGSAVAVSANLTVLAIGTETNGSIVCPAQANGIVGIKPTVGLASRSGIIPISFTQDTPGPMARTVRDAAICLGAMTQIDNRDEKMLASSRSPYTDYTPFLKTGDLAGKRIGLLTNAFGINEDVDSLMIEAKAFFEENGAIVVDVAEILTEEVGANSFEVMLYEYKDGLNAYFKSLGPDAPIKSVEELIAFNKLDSIELKYFDQLYLEMAFEKGDLSDEAYKTALEKARAGSRDFGIDKVMNELKLDAIIAPTGSPAWKTDLVNGDTFELGSSSPAAISGYPSITVPMGFIGDLPVGLSIFGRAWSEPLLIELAYSFEQGTKYRKAPRFLNQ